MMPRNPLEEIVGLSTVVQISMLHKSHQNGIEKQTIFLMQIHQILLYSYHSFDRHSWLHHVSEIPGQKLEQEKPKYAEDHIGNVSGTPLAYHPHNFMLNKEWQPVVQRGASYSRWTPSSSSSDKK